MQNANNQLIGLLSMAGYGDGYRQNGNTMFEDTQLVRAAQNELKPEYKTPESAMQAVVHATMAPTIDEYHQRLLDCQLYDGAVILTDKTPEEKEELQRDFLKDQARKSKESARDVQRMKVMESCESGFMIF